jgi:hypothetical protein
MTYKPAAKVSLLDPYVAPKVLSFLQEQSTLMYKYVSDDLNLWTKWISWWAGLFYAQAVYTSSKHRRMTTLTVPPPECNNTYKNDELDHSSTWVWNYVCATFDPTLSKYYNYKILIYVMLLKKLIGSHDFLCHTCLLYLRVRSASRSPCIWSPSSHKIDR